MFRWEVWDEIFPTGSRIFPLIPVSTVFAGISYLAGVPQEGKFHRRCQIVPFRKYLKIQMRQGGRMPYCLILWIPAFAGMTITVPREVLR